MRPIIWFIITSIVGIVFWISTTNQDTAKLFTSHSSKEDQLEQTNSFLSDRDSAAEEVRALATKITKLEQIIEKQQSQNMLEIATFRSETTNMLNTVHTTLDSVKEDPVDQQLLDSIQILSSRVDRLELQNREQITEFVQIPTKTSRFSWYQPEELEAITTSGDPFGLSFSRLENAATVTQHFNTETDDFTPHYTIPPTTTLMNATVLTALVGRIPTGGSLHDPWRFKIIVGSANLAANGHRIPQLSGMLLAGTARGDFALSCVSGNIDVATFIFSDGTIQTTRESDNTGNSSSGLGWISDEYGNPCIPGELKSNALKFLTQSTLIDATVATAGALANAQAQTKTIENTGDTIQSISGDLDDYFAGYVTKETLQGVSEWMDNRQFESFDAIYIPAGQSVAIHIEEPILIDYSATTRKIRNFESQAQNINVNHPWLD